MQPRTKTLSDLKDVLERYSIFKNNIAILTIKPVYTDTQMNRYRYIDETNIDTQINKLVDNIRKRSVGKLSVRKNVGSKGRGFESRYFECFMSTRLVIMVIGKCENIRGQSRQAKNK